jgi:hypothetical protein
MPRGVIVQPGRVGAPHGRRNLAAAMACLLLLACGDTDPARPGAAEMTFRVLATSPSHGARGVAVNRPPITVLFSEVVDAASIDAVAFRIDGEPAAEVEVTADGALLRPVRPFEHGRDYTVRVAATVRSAAGAALGREHAWSFQTKALP